ncbi:MAG: UxaA family hydrolase, partial [Clostridia bacterium]|nr:UxaA family hydrolase [Clostridia bacterium]
MKKITIHERDNVVVCIDGELSGHKIAKHDIKKGENVIKYGYPIGYATCDIKEGEHVHTHNTKTNLDGILEYTYEPQLSEEKKAETAYFDGYKREDGSVGVRNEIWIIGTVGCINKTAQLIVDKAKAKYPDMEICTFNHPFGCSQLGDKISHAGVSDRRGPEIFRNMDELTVKAAQTSEELLGAERIVSGEYE